jgi:adenylate kinase family enzyme
MSNAYIFYGKAGSGKGTQALELKKYLEAEGKKVIYIETGGLFRDFIASNDSFTAKRTSEIIDQGQLMPPFFPIYAWAHELIKNYTGEEEIIMDGVARRMEEAQILDSALDFFKIEKRFIFHIEIADQTAIDRLLIRGQGRPDDLSVEKIQNRLDWYRENVMPIFTYFHEHERYVFAEINGEESVEGVFNQIKQSLA